MKRVFSGVQPTNNLHIGNYLGALKNWIELQEKYECFYCVVDLHAITVKQDPKILRDNIINVARTYLALGIDPNRSTIFVQSEVKEHAELTWILNTIAKISELERMTQYKDKSKQHAENINVGLFDYPVLMAADILLYDTELVPVGDDQTQHVELARVIGRRFNQQFGEIFVCPEVLIKKQGARIMALDEPTKKMSKSAVSANNYIALLDNAEVVKKKISRAVTDSGSEIKADEDKPALTNLLSIYSLFTQKTVINIEEEYTNKGYADFKKGLAEVLNEFLQKFQKNFYSYKDSDVVDILHAGADKASAVAKRKMEKVRKLVGLGTR